MPEIVRINLDKILITIESTGYVSAVDISESLKTVQRINNQMGISKVIIDATHLVQLPTEPILHSLAADLVKLPSNMMYAFVVNESSPTVINYMQTVAQFKGITVEIFTNQDKGEAWLKGKTNTK